MTSANITSTTIKSFFLSLYESESSTIHVHEDSVRFTITITLYSEASINFGKLTKISEFFGTSDFDVKNKTEKWEYSEYTSGTDIFVIYEIKKSNIK